MSQQPNNQELKVELSEDMVEGVYSNLTIVSHAGPEFFFDFVRVVPNFPKAKVKARVVMSPQQAKYMLNALRENIKHYESLHGPITEEHFPPFPPNFNPAGQA